MPAADATSGFDAFFAREIEPLLGKYEIERQREWKRVRRRAAKILAVAVIFLIAFMIGTSTGLYSSFLLVVGLLFAYGAALSVTSGGEQWHMRVRDAFSAQIFGHFGFTWAAKPPEDFLIPFQRANILPRHDRHSLVEHVSGRVGDVDFELAEAHFVRRRSGRSGSSNVTVFMGLLVQFDFPKNFSGRTVIQDRSGGFNSEHPQAGARVHLESAMFEKAFRIFSTDQVEVRYLLTPAFMERLLALRKRAPGGLQAAFVDGHFWLAFDAQCGLFLRPDFWSDLRQTGRFEELLDDIRLIRDIAETLNLATQTRV